MFLVVLFLIQRASIDSGRGVPICKPVLKPKCFLIF